MKTCFLAGIACALTFAATAATNYPLPNAARIDEIAKTLPAAPGFAELNVTNRVFWDRAAKAAGWDYAINTAAALLDKPVEPPPDADYEKVYNWNTFSARIRWNIPKLALAECMENKGRFLPKLIEHLTVNAAQTTWMNPYHDRGGFGNFRGTYKSTDLDTAETAQAVAIALDFLRGRLPADVVARSRAALWRNCFSNYLAKADAPNDPKTRNGWFFGDANWNVACHGWCVGAALRAIDDVRTRARFVEAAERGYPYYVEGFSKDGYCHEGMDYWNFGFGMYLHLGMTVRAATGGKVDFFAHPMAKPDFLYAYESMMTMRTTLRYGDGMAGGPSDGNRWIGACVWPDLAMPDLVHAGTNVNGIASLPYRALPMIMGRHRMNASKPYVQPLRSFYPDAQVLVCRPAAPTRETLSATIRGGHNDCPHNHNDVGQYAIAIGDIQVVEDPAGQLYNLDTFTSRRYNSPMLNSYSHAVPRPDGQLQGAGRKYASKILAHGFAADRDWLVMDLKGAYALTNAAKLAKLTRRFEYARTSPAVTVEDEVAFTAPAAFETPISTFGRVLPGATPGTFVISRAAASGGEVRLSFTVDTHGAKWHLREEQVVNPRRERPTRWAVVLDEPVAAARITIRYAPDTGDFIRPDDRVAFLGDSITHGGAYGEYVNLFYATRYPGSNRWFSNSGWSGARLPQGIASVDEDIAAKNPTVVPVFYGMNDSGSKEVWPRGLANFDAKAAQTLATYAANYTNLLALIAAKANNPRIVYVTPSIFDQTCDDRGQTVATHKNDVMWMMSEWVKARAACAGAPCVNLYDSLLAINAREQAKDPSFSVLRQGRDEKGRLDRVHPGALGHMLFLYEFLRAFHAPTTVDVIERSVYKKNDISFSHTDRALPFPADANMARAYALCNFVEDYNRLILRVTALTPGSYTVTVDGRAIGQWTADELGAGVNIATNALSPQVRQAMEVKTLNATLWDRERDLRLFATRRRWLRMHYKVDPDDLAAVERLRGEIKEKKNLAYDYYTFGEYIRKWPDHEKVAAEAERLRGEIRKAAKPKRHEYRVYETSGKMVYQP